MSDLKRVFSANNLAEQRGLVKNHPSAGLDLYICNHTVIELLGISFITLMSSTIFKWKALVFFFIATTTISLFRALSTKGWWKENAIFKQSKKHFYPYQEKSPPIESVITNE